MSQKISKCKQTYTQSTKHQILFQRCKPLTHQRFRYHLLPCPCSARANKPNNKNLLSPKPRRHHNLYVPPSTNPLGSPETVAVNPTLLTFRVILALINKTLVILGAAIARAQGACALDARV